ncbi:nuclear pore complex protein An-Nup82 [Phlyctema vagabunda]|uniref:Nuclear pore complex protein An-Nup82 n=1 Tax=Phlyctema vagabunda TaxID=108571 RepID=A0ABR4PP07_9HELO
MPKVTSYTPAWLSKPTPGHGIFTATATNTSNGSGHELKKKKAKPGPNRRIVHRGTEVFIAVGKEIRWADLVYLKETWEDKQLSEKQARGKGKYASSPRDQPDDRNAQGYRTIKTPVADDIQQLIISPTGTYIAILTTYTVHIALLPESSYLTGLDDGPMRLKTYTLGPTTHVTSQSGIASALWHPLGVNGTCLVTVTKDAIVRIWELSITDRWSFDNPTLAIDLKKLADGTSLDQDFSASVSGTNKGFSPDSFEMEVASACFSGRGSGGWSPMTLWVAMREGDVYALCPLLPQKWSPPPTLVPSLSISIVAKVAAMEDDPEIPHSSKLLAQQQLAWMSDLDNQEPTYSECSTGEEPAEIYLRPNKPGRVPKLQGPFELELASEESDEELDNLLTDIIVIGAKVDADELMFGEEDDLEMDDAEQEGLSVGVICLLSSSGRLSICLDLEGVEAQWLPNSKSKHSRFLDDFDPPSLLTFQVMDTSKSSEVWEGSWPSFSQDVDSRYSFYITNTSSITYISLHPWIFRLETELSSDGVQGTDFRIDLLAKSRGSIRERVFTPKMDDRSAPLTASSLIRDPDLGYFLLSATPYGPLALTFESSESDNDMGLARRSASPSWDNEFEKPLILYEPRPAYEPPHALNADSGYLKFLQRLAQSQYRQILNQEVRMSPATLTIFTDAHTVLSEETHRLGTAAAELFRRCERLQVELQTQIRRAHEVTGRIEAITGEDIEVGVPVSANERIERRIRDAQQRQKDLTERMERMRRKVNKGVSRELSDKEREWIEEIKTLESNVISDGSDDEHDSARNSKQPWQRYEELQQLKDELLEQFQSERPNLSSPNLKVPSEVRKAKMAKINELLDRESALVEGAKSRLERLSLS